MDEGINTIFKLIYNIDAPKTESLKWILIFFGVIYLTVDFFNSSKEKIKTVSSFVKYIKKLPNCKIINYNIVYPMNDSDRRYYKINLVQNYLRLSKVFWPFGICLITISSSIFCIYYMTNNEWLAAVIIETCLFLLLFCLRLLKKSNVNKLIPELVILLINTNSIIYISMHFCATELHYRIMFILVSTLNFLILEYILYKNSVLLIYNSNKKNLVLQDFIIVCEIIYIFLYDKVNDVFTMATIVLYILIIIDCHRISNYRSEHQKVHIIIKSDDRTFYTCEDIFQCKNGLVQFMDEENNLILVHKDKITEIKYKVYFYSHKKMNKKIMCALQGGGIKICDDYSFIGNEWVCLKRIVDNYKEYEIIYIDKIDTIEEYSTLNTNIMPM